MFVYNIDTPDGEAATLPSQGKGCSVRGPPEAGNGARTSRIVSGRKNETVWDDEAACQIVDAVHNTLGTES